MLPSILFLILFFIGNVFSIFSCPFCNNLEGYSQIYKQLYSDVAKDNNMILKQTKHFYVISDNYIDDASLLTLLKQNTECLVDGEKDFESYLFLKYSRDKAFVIPENLISSDIPSQFFRKIFANIAYGEIAFWDWKNPISEEIRKKLQNRLLFVLEKFNKNANQVIKEA